MSRVPITALAVLAAAPLGLAACSSSTHGNGAGGSGQHSSAAAPANPAQPSQASQASQASQSSAPASGPASAGYCSLLAKNNQVLIDIGAGDSRPGGVDVGKLKQDMQAEVDQAPADIKADLQTIVDFDVALMDGKTDIKETPALQGAMAHYATWIAANCPGISTLPTGSTS